MDIKPLISARFGTPLGRAETGERSSGAEVGTRVPHLQTLFIKLDSMMDKG